MKRSSQIPIQMLGQSGVRLNFAGLTVYVDPYLSNSVQSLHDADLIRQLPIPVFPLEVTDADLILITHGHTDHCDPQTLPIIALASPRARFICPATVAVKLSEWGIHSGCIAIATEEWIEFESGIRIKAVPAAHPEVVRDFFGRLTCVGYLIEVLGRRIYIAGDTGVKQEIIDILVADGPIHTAFLPVNEQNFFRERRGIIGNMSVREAFQFAEEIGVRQVVAVHWDMFTANAVDPDEIRLIHQRMNFNFTLLINPSHLSFADVQASIVIRTLNEARYLESLLNRIALQQTNGINYEIIVVDSGSTDGTLDIAARHDCRILHIAREDFSFGRSLNMGCQAAVGETLVIVSGHCVPTDEHWLQKLCQPLLDDNAEYSYGRQYGGPDTHFSESRIFAKFYPSQSCIPQNGYFCNNANAALLRKIWEQHRFDEDLTGLEDMELAQRLVNAGGRIAYVSDATVFHYHDETGLQIRLRFEREAIALQKIMPQIQISLIDTLRYIASSVWKDWICARRARSPGVRINKLFMYRWNQYIGAWKGNHQHRKLSRIEKERYFFPH
jgi:L-ascorbate metabolism protein UlaG (beta-lactamase superfamily)/glycosyltransferase involved in cell wall biosynthesis